MNTGKRIAKLRDSRGISQKDLANEAGINPSVMNRIELGLRPLKADELKVISRILNVPADYLLGTSIEGSRLSPEQGEKITELVDIIFAMEEDKRNKEIAKIISYAKGLADADYPPNS